MKKKFLPLLGTLCFSLMLGVSACQRSANPSESSGDTQPIQKTWTVAFEVEGARYKTLKVKDGEKITETVANPTKEGFLFTGWYEGTELVDLAEYVVTKNVTFVAHFEEDSGPQLNVDDVKDATKTYYAVLGWWETTAMEDDNVTPKVTSGMDRTSVRLFYGNLIKYFKALGATDSQVEAISFRNYSSDTVANMGTAVNGDADVDLLIGVGPNVFTTAACVPFDTSANSKFETTMGSANKSRYVALLKNAREVSQAAYTWLQTETGKASFLRELTDAEIAQSLLPEACDLTVTVHGDTNETTVLDDVEDIITMPTITVAENHEFKGFATTENAETAQLVVAKDAELKYNDVKDLVAENATTLDLYPVIKEIATLNLTVTVHGDTNAETVLTNDSMPITMPEITVPTSYEFLGFATVQNATVAELVVAIDAELTYADIQNLVPENATTFDLYPVFQYVDLYIYVQVNGSYLTMPEALLLKARYLETLTNKNVKFNIIEAGAADFKAALGSDADVIIGGDNPVKDYTAHEQGPKVNCGAKHFVSTNRKVIIKDTVNTDHLILAKAFYDFVTAEAPQFELHIAFWPKNGSWVKTEEEDALKDNIQTQVKTYMNVTGTDTVLDKYNIVITFVDVAGTAVASLGTDTLALREGKGTDLLIGCGANVTSTGGVNVVEKKNIPTSMVAAGRMVALVREHFLARNVYEVVFAEPVQPEA